MRVATRWWLGLAGGVVLSAALSCDGDGGAGAVVDADAGREVPSDVPVARDVGSAPDLSGTDAVERDLAVLDVGGEDAGGDTAGSHQIRIAGLSAPVDVYVDESGVMHLGCATDSDCLMGLGYVHAHRRFFLMDLNRRSVTGRLATLYGVLGVPTDEQSLGYYATSTGENVYEAMWAKLSPETQEVFHAYAAGVNCWLDDMRAGLVAEQEQYWYRNPWADYFPDDVLETIPDWDVLDSVAIWFVQMQGNGDLDVAPI